MDDQLSKFLADHAKAERQFHVINVALSVGMLAVIALCFVFLAIGLWVLIKMAGAM